MTAADLLRAISPFAICPTPDRGVPGVGRIAMHGIVNRSASPAAGGFNRSAVIFLYRIDPAEIRVARCDHVCNCPSSGVRHLVAGL